MAMLVFILAAASFLSAITAIRFAIHGREVAMPNLVGKSVTDVQNILAGLRLRMKVADRVYDDLPVNYIVRQSPPAGMHVKIAQQAQVVLSLGPRAVTIPSLEGKSLRAARIELLRDSLQVGEISSAYLPEFPGDAVVQQDPRPGSGAASPRVNLLVSQGAREPAFVMPYLVGLNRAEVERQLAVAGLRAAKVALLPAPQWPHDAVIGQTPSQGARVTPRMGVELQIAE
jgi:serine/threonine-protein kinase